MSILSLILAALLLASWIVAVKSEIKLKVNKISEFPFSANKMFEIEITPTDPNGSLSTSLHDSMVIAIVGPDGRVVEKAIFDYGFKDMIDEERKGKLMRIPVWQKTPDGHAMIAHIAFTRLANGRSLEIYQLVADSGLERRDKLIELPKNDRIYQRDIELLVPPKIELAIEASDGRKNEFVLDNQGMAYCHAYDGVPNARPVFLNANEFQVEDSAFNERDNRLVLRLRVSMRDHLKTLRCRAGSSEESVKIIVLHHSSQVTLEPEIAQGATIENGSSVTCTSVDGYPPPIMRWVLVSGPPNASGYFNISLDGRMLHLSSRTPLGSLWAFNCTATNLLPSSRRIFNRTVEFSVGRRIVWAENFDTETISLTEVSIPKFPFQMEKPFLMIFGTNARNGILSKSIIDTMVIHISNSEGLGETAVFDFGFKDSIDSEFSGQFMRIPSWEKDVENGAITATIFFTKVANNKSLEVYHISVDTSKERKDALKNLKLAKQVYRASISLLVSPTMEMSINSNNNDVAILSTDKVHFVTCRAYDGIPWKTPRLSGLKMRRIFSGSLIAVIGEFQVLPTDHGKNLTCTAGTAKKHITVKVPHAPSRIELEPNIAGTMGNGSSVVCRAVDGYPTPMTSWHFLKGPEGAAKFYIISYDKQSIYFKRSTPLGTKWAFQCSAWNTINGTRQYFNKTVKFTIGHINQNESFSSANDTQEKEKKWDRWEITEKYDKEQMIRMKKIVYKNSKDIGKLNKNLDKQNKEINKLRAAVAMGKSENSKLKSQLTRLAVAQTMQNMKFLRLKRYVDDKIATRRYQGVKVTTEDPQKKFHSAGRSEEKDKNSKRSMMRPVVWKIDDVLKLRKKRRSIRSKRFYLAHSDRAMAMVLDFTGYRNLRLSLHMYPFRKMGGRKTVKGSFSVTIADAENSSSKKTEEKKFEIGMEPVQMDILFEYAELMNRDVFENDKIAIRLTGYWDI